MPYIAISIVVLAIITVGVIYSGRKRIRQENKKPNKAMFWIGIAIVAIAVTFFLTAKGEMEDKMWAVPIWMMGTGLIAGSNFRLFK